MRTVDSAINTAEEQTVRDDTHGLTARNELLQFAAVGTQVNALLDTGVPQTYMMSNLGGRSAYATLRKTDGTAWAVNFDIGMASEWALPTLGELQLSGAGASAEYRVMRYGMSIEAFGNDLIDVLWAATHTGAAGSGVQVVKGPISSFTPSNVGTAFGAAAQDDSSAVVRVEAVCPVSDTAFVCAIGTHNFDDGYSTIQFWFYDGATLTQLNTVIQMALDQRPSEWYDIAKYATYISATLDTDGVLHIYANSHPDGRMVQWTVKQGVESIVTPVVGIDPEYGIVGFSAASVCKLGDLYYMPGRIIYTWDDITTMAFDCYVTSVDAEHWSFGERGFYIQDEDSAGALLVDASVDPVVVYYGGNLSASVATLTPAQGYNTTHSSQYFALSTRMGDFKLSQPSNAPQQLSLPIRNTDGVLSDHAVVHNGAILTLTSGQGGTNTAIGLYDVDMPDTGITNTDGTLPLQLKARDYAHKALMRHNLNASVDYWGMDIVESSLSTLDRLVVKTRAADVLVKDSTTPGAQDLTLFDHILGAEGLQSKALNNPLILQADVANAGVILQKAEVTFPDTGDEHALAVFGFTFGSNDDQFIAALIPKTSDWKNQPKPRIMRSTLKPWVSADMTGGYTFESRYQGLWQSNNEGTGEAFYLTATKEGSGSYSVDSEFEAIEGTAYEFASRMAGGLITIYQKVRDYSKEGCSDAADWNTTQAYRCGSEHLYNPAGRVRPGMIVNTDVLANKAALEDGAIGELVAGLTDAGEYDALVADYTLAIGTFNVGSGTVTTFNLSSIDAAYQDRLSATTVIRVVNADHDALFSIVSIVGNTVKVSGNIGVATPPSTTVYLASATALYAYASSRMIKQAVTGGDVRPEQNVIKSEFSLRGRGAFITEDGTAISIRAVASDGIKHLLYSGGPRLLGWDATNPIGDAGPWRLVFNHGYIMNGAMTDEGLEAAGHLIVDHEAIRYLELTSRQRSSTDETVWTIVPAYYTPLATSTGAVTRLTQWSSGGGIYPGDDPNGIADAVGLLAEIISSDAQSNRDAPAVQRYITAVGSHYADISPSYPNDISEVTADTTCDLAVFSGRGALGTTKAKHEPGAPVCFYPSPVGGSAITSLVTVTAYDCYSGAHRCVEDVLTQLCALAGVRRATFHNYMTGAAGIAPHPMTLTTTPTALPLIDTMKEFTLIGNVYLDSGSYLQIDFRDYYRLSIIEEDAGMLKLGIETTSTDLDAGSDGHKWFEVAYVRVSALNMCNTVADVVALRMGVVDNRVTVEINGLPVWVFNLSRYQLNGTQYGASAGAAAVKLSYSSTVANNAGTWRVPELWQEVTTLTAPIGSNTWAVIQQLCDRYYIKTRATSDGGILFSSFHARSTLNTVVKHLRVYKTGSDDAAVAVHTIVAGEKSGGYIDTAIVRSQGYSFNLTQQGNVKTVQQAKDSAHLLVREAIEYAETVTMEGRGRVAHEVEDVIPINISGDVIVTTVPGSLWGGMPWFISDPITVETPVDPSYFVITGIEWQTKNKLLYASYKLRAYQAWS